MKKFTQLNENIENLETKHSKEPWIYREFPDQRDCFVQAKRNKPTDPYDIEILGDDTNPDLYPIEQKMADAKRIVACVNAFEGIDDPIEWMKKYK